MDNKTPPDLDALLAFAAIARERNMRKAAQALHISQPPLSRKLRRLEESLGIILFRRRSDGMELTREGSDVLAIIGPFLKHAGEIAEKLALVGRSENRQCVLGLTTAFEQAVFAPYVKLWRQEFGDSLVRKESPQLARDVARGKAAAAFVALPLETYGLSVVEVNYSERLLAVLPKCWPEADNDPIPLEALNGKPMFWFQRRRNPVYFDYMMGIFRLQNCFPLFVEEPCEHDVLLARIAFGDGWTLLPESFTVLPREGVKFVPISQKSELYIRLGFIHKDGRFLLKAIKDK